MEVRKGKLDGKIVLRLITYIVTHLDLANREPFEVRPHGVHLPLVNGHTSVLDKRGFRVVELGRAISVSVVCNLWWPHMLVVLVGV